MKASFILRFAKLSAVLGGAAAVAASCGMSWSDATLKQEIRPVEGALAKLRQIS